MHELIFLVEEASEGGYTAQALGQPIFTKADSIEELRTMVRDIDIACDIFAFAGRVENID